jgi:hypothetical protein
MMVSGLPLWSSGQSSLLEMQRSGFDSLRYQIFSEVVGLEWGPLSLMSAIQELLGRNTSGSSPEIREYGRRDPSRRPHATLYPQNVSLTSPTNDDRSVDIVDIARGLRLRRWWSCVADEFTWKHNVSGESTKFFEVEVKTVFLVYIVISAARWFSWLRMDLEGSSNSLTGTLYRNFPIGAEQN